MPRLELAPEFELYLYNLVDGFKKLKRIQFLFIEF